MRKAKTKSSKLYFSGIVFFLVVFISCHKEADIPSYIHIDKISFSAAADGSQGSSSQKIVDAWIDIDGKSAGAFEMPFTIPLLYYGEHTITVFSGIKENGITDTRIQYPFYSTYTQTVTLTPGSILKINPTVTYAGFTYFSFIQEFSGGSTGMLDSSGTDTSMRIIATPSLEMPGEGQCGGVVLTGNRNTYYGVTSTKYVLPIVSPIFLELNYNCNTEFYVGVVAYDASGQYVGQTVALTLRSTTGWNKVYINLSTAVIGFSAAKYAIYYSMIKHNDPSYFYLDNVKLIY